MYLGHKTLNACMQLRGKYYSLSFKFHTSSEDSLGGRAADVRV
jgi:hypothetical protein